MMNRKLFLMITALLLSAVITIAYQHNSSSHNLVTPLKNAVRPAPKYDARLLDTFNKIAGTLDVRHTPCTYSGEITVTDRADSLQNNRNVPFLYSQNGADCYYRYGSTEMLNAGGIYLFISHDQHKVMVSAQKTISTEGVGSLAMFKSGMASEHYLLSSDTKKNIRTIRLLNEHHISCKEYKISYDTLSREVKEIYARLPNSADPANPAMDRIVDVHFQRWVRRAEIAKHLQAEHVVRTDGDELKLTADYHNYELVRTQ
ncbi:hypothetical protein KXD93_10875 [Mucilaginibacter sp. BJC16-A38]|uniref:hypothetical protein n=1 Tax=Mucilaginibacter phenanthrenivorans TaxID=1234842 RepID=UPI0021578E3B|nr:hypothetical protein [Mucilaginibacter phenanthrenivorans]MCR8558151.1 hypothetical protein [Mucilaginibacter phenanthrenivorans]